MASINFDLTNVPVVDIHKENLTQIWPSLIHALNTSLYVAMDIELSGLGNRKSIMAKVIDERYTEISKTAQTRSILSLGLSCFRLEPNEENTERDQQTSYCVQTFNLTVLCNEDYVVEPASLQFLVQHGFDFNKQHSIGIPYLPGNDREEKNGTVEERPSIRRLFSELLQSRKPLIIHNGLVDLVFLYHHFYATLPSKLAVFVADLSEMFPGGIYDTKYLSEFAMRHPASYLEYVFRKLQQQNDSQPNQHKKVLISFPNYGEDLHCVEYRDLSPSIVNGLTLSDICERYANHGWCTNSTNCKLSHDVSAIVQVHQTSSKTAIRKAKKRKQLEQYDNDANKEQSINKEQNCIRKNVVNTHRAGYDAFMTGFAMAVFMKTLKMADLTLVDSPIQKLSNRICLSGKDQPLLIQKSSFAKTSRQHQAKTAA